MAAGSALLALKEGSTRIVEHEGFEYRIEAITARDLLYHSAQFFAHIDVQSAIANARLAAQGVEPSEGDAEDKSSAQIAAEILTQLPAEELAQKGQSMEAAVIRGVRAVRAKGSESWDLVTLCMQRGEETAHTVDYDAVDEDDPATWPWDENDPMTYPRLWVGRLPQGAVAFLFEQVIELSSDGGRAHDALKNFRRGSDGRADGRQNRKKAG